MTAHATRIPEALTHNFDPAPGPLRNICALPDAEAERIIDEIRASGRRSIKANYLRRRRAVEDWLIAKRRRKLGRTRLERPLYFFLGDFADGLDPSRPESLIMPLAAFSPDCLTFTYPDSMASLPLARRDEHAAERRPYHGQVFTLSEIKAVVAEVGMPGDCRKTDPARRYDRFIEVQVWDDRPVEPLLDRR